MAKNLSTFAIAKMLNVDPGSVANWIDQGLLKAHRTPGGHRRVLEENLLKFLHEHQMPIPSKLKVGPPKILIVDDEQAITQMITRAIHSVHPDFEVQEAHDGFKAGTVLANLHPDLVILDLRMPGIDGFEVCRMIKSQDSTSHAAVVAMTAYTSPESETRILECGAKVCLQKPLNMDLLLKEIESCLA